MTRARFFSSAALAAGQQVPLDDAAAHHASHVLRLRVGDPVVLFDGRGGEYRAVLTQVEKKHVLARIDEHLPIERESPLNVVLVQAVSARERMDVTLQKAVELGVARVQPVMAQRGVVKLSGERAEHRVQHWQQVVISACEQCGRNRVPLVSPLLTLTDYLQRPPSTRVRWLLSPAADQVLRTLPRPADGVELLVGPEGGFTPQEEQAAGAAGFVALRLGPRVLRTETAAPALLAALQVLWGDF
jgi:16S rRNA (uracil1498-N3)-methyltransferase